MTEQIKLNNKLSLLSDLIDGRCDAYGVRNTICYLLDFGLTKEEIMDLQFNEEDVDYVIANPDDDYSDE